MEKSNADCHPGIGTGANESSSVENESFDGILTSYGIEISRKEIKSVPFDEQDTALKDLGVSAYEQEDFEEGVLKQVDKAIEQRQTVIAKEALERDLSNIKDELKTSEEDLEKVERTISAFSGDASADYNVRRGLESMKIHREIKLRQLQKLQARQKEILKNIEILHVQAKTKIGCATTTVTKHDVLGEIDFGIKTFETDDEQASDLHTSSDLPTCSDLPTSSSVDAVWNDIGVFEDTVEQDKYDKIKSKRRKVDIREEFSDSYSSSEEYIPYPDEVSDELTDEGEGDEFLDKKKKRFSETYKKKKKIKTGSHHEKLVSDLKENKSGISKKVIDDGNIKAYNERVRIHRLKERLKISDVAVADGQQSEEEVNDDQEISLKRGFSLPVKMWRKLFKYQRTGVKWLWELHCQDAGGILGDEMGLGKTIQVIAFLAGLKKLRSGRQSFGPSLITCPATVLHQWVKEFHKWAPEFRVAILHETGSFNGRKEALIKHIVDDKGVLVTSYSNLRIHEDELLRYHWDYVILDEGHKIRNPDAKITLACKQFTTPHRLILSGSPLQNNLKELWSLFDFIFPGKLGTLPVFMTEFSVPITLGGYANATDVQVQTAYKCACILRDTISPYLLRRMKKDVKISIQLPSKNEQVLFCRLTDEQRDLYKKYINSREVCSILAGNMKVFPGLIMVRKICNHPDLSSAAGSLDWMKASKKLKSANSEQDSTKEEIEFDQGYGHWKRSGKMIVVESLLKLWKQQNHRVLLFSQTKQMLDIMESFVKNRKYTYVRMDGSTSIGSRQPSVDRFNQDKSIFVFLLTTRVGGLGVNLIGADRVVIYDPDWNPSTDTQARERSWRIGQDKHVTIYRLLTTGTIEEKIYHRQIFKQFLTNRVLKNPSQRRFFKSNDLYELFTLGDERPGQESTETGALFAGTGSEVSLQQIKSRTTKREAKIFALNAKKAERRRKEMKEKVKRISASLSKRSLEGNAVSKSKNVSFANEDFEMKNDDKSESALTYESLNDIETRMTDSERTAMKLEDGPTGAKRQIPRGEKSKKRKNRKRKIATVDGTEIDYLDKQTIFVEEENGDPKSNKKMNKKHDEEILHVLFENTGVHSALKHDKIVESGNADYVLVEKEAERVAKQAAEALRKSRALCRNVSVGVPTWTGAHGSAGIPSVKNPRFGVKKSAKSEVSEPTARVDVRMKTFDGADMLGSTNTAANDLSSASLLKRMRARSALGGGTANTEIDHRLYSVNPKSFDSKETELVADIRHFVALEARNLGKATTHEILEKFKPRIADEKNALFKEMLKQVCDFQKINGVGTWHLKDNFK